MTRISRHMMFMEIAHVVAKRSTCLRLNVGAVLVSPINRPVSIGYNGQAPGQDHCTSPCGEGACNTIHAEMNALYHAPVGAHMCGERHTMYVTDSPCPDCAQELVWSGMIRAVYFQTPYRVQDGYQHLISAGIFVARVLPSGAIIDMETSRVLPA